MWNLDRLPMARAFMYGPRWRRHFHVREVPIADIDAAAARLHRPGRKVLMFSLEDEVRERIARGAGACDELRQGVFEEWNDAPC